MLETYRNMRKSVDSNKDMYEITDSDLQDIQATLTGMILDISDFCEKHGLTYALCGGSCLGTVRHKGFIPWDDDIDICMPRPDYERFMDLFSQEMADSYWIQNIRRDPDYDLNFSKVRKKGTVFEEIYETEPEKAGMFIDIFPVDGTYDSKLLRTLHQMLCDGLLLIASCVRIHGKLPKLLKYAGGDKQVERSLRIKNTIGICFSFFSLRRWLLLTEDAVAMCRDRQSRYVFIPSGIRHARGETYKRIWFFPSRKLPFGETRLYTLNHPAPYLKKLYGDYMVIPPEADRMRHSVLRYSNPR